MRGFDERLLARVPHYLARLRADDRLCDDTRQALRARLLLAPAGTAPRITQYRGLGALDAWVRVAAVRAALNLLDAEKRRGGSELPDDQVLPAGGDLELDYLRDRYRGTFAVALKRAVAELPANDRALLRFHFVDGLTPGHIGDIYGLHRTTAMRRIAAARQLLLEATRSYVMRELHMSPSECDSLVGLVGSNLPITLGSLFRSKAP
jgi:RNA polymerase sigma-70 factor (ECF subfamily)